MNDLAFYNEGGQSRGGVRQGVVLARRLLRRVLRPIFMRQVEIFQHLVDRLDRLAPRVDAHEHAVWALRSDADSLKQRQDEVSRRQEEVSEQLQTALAFGWDYVALVRRLATLEDQVASLTGVVPAVSTDDAENHSSILFPGIEKATRKPAADADGEVRSRVC